MGGGGGEEGRVLRLTPMVIDYDDDACFNAACLACILGSRLRLRLRLRPMRMGIIERRQVNKLRLAVLSWMDVKAIDLSAEELQPVMLDWLCWSAGETGDLTRCWP